jgi:hypothetical protein
MAKPKDKPAERSEAQPLRSVLMRAWERFEAGDMVQARQLAEAVLGGKVGPDEQEGATHLAQLMSGNETLPVAETVESVARAMVERTKPVPKSYLFAAVSVGVLALLVVLAVTRYGNS